MSFLKKTKHKDQKKGGSHNAVPMFDPYHQWGDKPKKGFGLAQARDDHMILPGVTPYEERKLRKIKDYVEKQTGEKCTLPQHLIDDVYSMYVNGDIKRKPTTKGTTLKAKIMDKVYNSLTKVLTTDSPLFSQVLTREVAVYMQEVQRQLEEEEQKQQQGGGNGEGDGEGEEGGSAPAEGEGVFDDRGDEEGEEGEASGGGPESGEAEGPGSKGNEKSTHGELDPNDLLEEKLDDILDQTEHKLDKAMNKAEKKMEDLKEQLGEEALEELSSEDPEFLDTVDSLKDALNKIKISKDSIRQVLSKILNESSNYFSLKYKTKDESIFEADDLDDLQGLEYLSPLFRNTMLMDAVNETRIYKGKIDLYLDCSGSMGSRETFEGTNIRMIDLVKGIAIVLFRMKMLDKLYFFDTSLYEIKNINEFTILAFNRSGGTDFDKVVNQARINGRNSVCITDGEDNCSEYIKNIFWVGVGGTQFTSYWGDGNAFDIYKTNKQCVTYNSGNGLFDHV